MEEIEKKMDEVRMRALRKLPEGKKELLGLNIKKEEKEKFVDEEEELKALFG